MLQTAHEPSYLVKHLLGSLPPVVERVKLMRKGQAPNGSLEENLVKMAQSQVCCLLVITHIILVFTMLSWLPNSMCMLILHLVSDVCWHHLARTQ